MTGSIKTHVEKAVSQLERALPPRLMLAVAAFLLVAAVVLSAALISRNEGIKTVALVNGEAISENELISAMRELHGQSVLEMLITGRLIMQEAEKGGIVISDEEIDAGIAALAADTFKVSEEEFYLLFEEQGRSVDLFRDYFSPSIALRKLALAEFDPGEDEILAFYENNVSFFGRVEEVEARHILVETEEEAANIARRLRGGADFVSLAREHSMDFNSKDEGGYLGYFSRGRMPPEFDAAAFDLQIGEFSDPVATMYGYHVIQLLDRSEADEIDFQEIREDVLAVMIEVNLDQLMDQKLRRLQDEAEIEYIY